MRYRPDVDGLRAVAILLVVAFHVGIPGIGGGFVGVDVFFVISGFLITSQLLDDVDRNGRVSILNFYARRIRRLLPALVVMVVATSMLACFVLVPDPELRWFAQSVIALALGASNIFFLIKTDGYFDAAAELQPFLHTWSLAVEEQFYVVWPLILWFVAKRYSATRRSALTWTIAVLSALSFVLSVWMVRVHDQAAFYIMPTRLWELGIGATIAILGLSSSRKLWPAVGIVLMCASAMGLDQSVAFPGISAVPAVLGAALVVAGGASGGVLIRGLGHPLMVAIGKRSYSWYLFHWPALTLARIESMDHRLWRDLAIAVGTYILADLSYRLVENPFRRAPEARPQWARASFSTVVAGAATLGAIIVVGAMLVLNTGSASRVPLTDSQRQALAENRTAREMCPNLPPDPSSPHDCSFPGGPESERSSAGRIVLVGDSHALALLPVMREVAAKRGLTLTMMWDTGCPALLGYIAPPAFPEVPEKCRAEDRLREQELRSMEGGVELILVTGRYSSFLRGQGSTLLAEERLGDSLLDGLEGIEAPILLVQDVPRFERDVPQCLARRSDCAIQRAKAVTERQPEARVFERVASRSQVATWDPFTSLCTERFCPGASSDGTVLYRDRDHLSVAGSLTLEPSLGAVVDDLLKLRPRDS